MAYANWAAVPVAVQSRIGDLLHQWNGLTMGNITPPNWALLEMVNQGITSLEAFGQYMQGHMGSGSGLYFVPVSQYAVSGAWANAGLTQDQYFSGLSQYQNVMEQYLGNTGSMVDYNNTLQQMHGDLNTSQLVENIIHSASMRQQYGWLRYGMTYDQFRQQKVTMQQALGHQISDQQGVTQLDYQRSIGINQSAAASPTFTQQEKLQAQKGAAATTSAIR